MALTLKSPLSFPRRRGGAPTLAPARHCQLSTTIGYLSLFPCPPPSSFRRQERKSVPKTNASIDGTKQEEEQFQLVTSLRSRYNDIVIVDTQQCRTLLLDSTYNVHSVFTQEQKWTGSYWDEFVSLPAIIPEGPIAILGLGGGTCARLMLDVWPSLKLEGWEIDEILVDKAREYLGLSDLEKSTRSGGILCVHVGDALSPSASVPGGFAGIVVDLFSGGKVLPQLQEVTAWMELYKKLMPHGRIMVNCGGASAKTTDCTDGISDGSLLSNDGLWRQNSVIKTLTNIFPETLSWKKMGEGENFLALTGPFPDLDMWSDAVPEQLKSNVKQWLPCQLLP